MKINNILLLLLNVWAVCADQTPIEFQAAQLSLTNKLLGGYSSDAKPTEYIYGSYINASIILRGHDLSNFAYVY